MAVLSVQICVGLKVLKKWGLHPINELATLAEVFRQFCLQDIDGCHGFLFPDDLKDQAFECFVASSSSGPFQSSFSSASIGDIMCFGKYLKFVIVSPEKAVVEPVRPLLDAVQIMRDAQLSKYIPKKVAEHTSKDKLRNQFIDLLEEQKLGWSNDTVESTGKKFVNVLTDILWYVDGYEQTITTTHDVHQSLF